VSLATVPSSGRKELVFRLFFGVQAPACKLLDGLFRSKKSRIITILKIEYDHNLSLLSQESCARIAAIHNLFTRAATRTHTLSGEYSDEP
jgi:hypothetical protein